MTDLGVDNQNAENINPIDQDINEGKDANPGEDKQSVSISFSRKQYIFYFLIINLSTGGGTPCTGRGREDPTTRGRGGCRYGCC